MSDALFGWFGRGGFCETVVLGGWVVSGKWRNGGLKIFSCPMDCQVTPQLQESLPGPFKGAVGKRLEHCFSAWHHGLSTVSRPKLKVDHR